MTVRVLNPASMEPRDSHSQQARIDEAIEEHLKAITRLRYERNTYSRINQLPAEILARIFEFGGPTINVDKDDMKVIFLLSKICRYWRNLAYETPSLWSCIPLWSSRWAKEFLCRSKLVPLSIAVTSEQALRLFKELITPQKGVSRIQEFRVRGSLQLLQEVAPLICKEMPALRGVSVVRTRLGGYNGDETSFSPFPLTPKLAPHIRRLELVHALPPYWGEEWFNSLTHLSLIWEYPSDNLPLDDLSDSLNQMAHLESLILFNTLPSSTTTIRLMKLTELELMGTSTKIDNFLASLECPRSARLSMDIHVPLRSSSVPPTSILKTVAERCAKYQTPVRMLALQGARGEIELRAGINDIDLDILVNPGASKPHITISWMIQPPDRDMLEPIICRNIFTVLPTSSTKAVYVDHRIFYKEELWGELLGPLALERLIVMHNSAGGLARAMFESYQSEKRNRNHRKQKRKGREPKRNLQPEPKPILAQLRWLIFRHVDFSSLGLDIRQFHACLQSRKARGFGLHRFEVDRCTRFTVKNCGSFKNVVNDLVWDGTDSYANRAIDWDLDFGVYDESDIDYEEYMFGGGTNSDYGTEDSVLFDPYY
jgi:hypothetical protein